MEAYSVFSVSSSVTILWSTCGRQSLHFSFPDYTNSGVFSRLACGCSFLLGKLVIGTGSWERGAQPFKNECWQGLGIYFSVSGVQMRKHSSSACVVLMFRLGAHPAAFWTAPSPSPAPFLADSVIKGGREGRPSLTLPGDQIDGCLPRSPEIPAESWPLTERHKTSPVSFTAVVAMADPNNMPQLLSPPASSPPPTDSTVDRRRWTLLDGGNSEAGKDRQGI